MGLGLASGLGWVGSGSGKKIYVGLGLGPEKKICGSGSGYKIFFFWVWVPAWVQNFSVYLVGLLPFAAGI